MTIMDERGIYDGPPSTLGDYREFTDSVLMLDDPVAPEPTIRGLPREAYLYVGLQEEAAELTGRPDSNGELPDVFDPRYDRAAMLRLPVEEAAEYFEMAADMRVHAKEMGDVLWYVTQTLAAFGERIDSVFRWYMSADSAPHVPDTFSVVDELARWDDSLITEVRANALDVFDGLYERYRAACEAALKEGGTEETLWELRITAPPLLIGMAAISQERFGLTLGDIAAENKRKLLARLCTNTIFGNGDFREEQIAS